MTQKSVGKTANIEYLYDDALADPVVAKARAESLFESGDCESDLATLEGWFGVNGGFGPGNRIKVIIDRPGSLGLNGGYHTDGSTSIQIAPFDDNPVGVDDPRFDAAFSDKRVRAVYVAELAEVLMSYRKGQTGAPNWNSGDSMGEALSTVSEALAHSDGYYTKNSAGQGIGPRVGQWLNAAPRPDWISQTKGTDKDFPSIGCGVMFLYFLLWECDFTIEAVIAGKGGSFEDLFTNLTGIDNVWPLFRDVVAATLPVGTPVDPVSDDLLPHPGKGPGLVGSGRTLYTAWKGESGRRSALLGDSGWRQVDEPGNHAGQQQHRPRSVCPERGRVRSLEGRAG